MYLRAIINECGEVIEYASNLTEEEVNKVLREYPEYRLACVFVEA